MKQKFKDCNFRDDRKETIERANTIIADYQQQNLVLTLRQLYYQFVTRNWLANTERSYKNLGTCISEGRLAGLIDWRGIEDRVRVPRTQSEWNDIKDLVNSAVSCFRLPRWEGQEYYVELWVEKDALAGVLEPIASEYHITLMVNRGYSSQSAMYESARRFRANAGRKGILLYLGDHDPSGEDMVRDISERLTMFLAKVEVEKIALTMAQVQEYNPPPNPAKMSDSRAANYVAEHGNESWEVDALPPEVLSRLITERLEELVDHDLMDEIINKEELDKEALRRAANRIVKRK